MLNQLAFKVVFLRKYRSINFKSANKMFPKSCPQKTGITQFENLTHFRVIKYFSFVSSHCRHSIISYHSVFDADNGRRGHVAARVRAWLRAGGRQTPKVLLLSVGRTCNALTKWLAGWSVSESIIFNGHFLIRTQYVSVHPSTHPQASDWICVKSIEWQQLFYVWNFFVLNRNLTYK